MTKTIDWAAAVDGDFATDANWVGGAEPTKNQTANLQGIEGSPYAVTFDTSPGGKHGATPVTIGGLRVGYGVTFDEVEDLNVGRYYYKKTGQFYNDGTVNITNNAALRDTGTLTNNGVINLDNGAIIIEYDYVPAGINGATLVNNGQIDLNEGALVQTVDVDRLVNVGTISGPGDISIIIDNLGTIAAGVPPGGVVGTSINYGGVNDGLLEAIDGGALFIIGAITGSGSVAVDGGTFEISPYGGGIFSQNVNFGGSASSIFELGNSVQFEGQETYTGTITGFSKKGNSAIVLADMVGSGSAAVTYTGTKKGGVLTITGDGHSDTLTFAGNYLNVMFSAIMTSSDTTVTAVGGGVEAADLSGRAPLVALFATAMAAITGHGVAAGIIDHHTLSEGRQLMLAEPRLAIA
jgi:hypothetical protein